MKFEYILALLGIVGVIVGTVAEDNTVLIQGTILNCTALILFKLEIKQNDYM